MDKQAIIDKLMAFAQRVKGICALEMVVFYGAWLADMAREDDEIEVAVIFSRLSADCDYLETREKLENIAHEIDSRIEPTVFERDKKDTVGFLQEILENGMIIYQAPGSSESNH